MTTLKCDDGTAYDVVVAGGHNSDCGHLQAAHDRSATANFVSPRSRDFAETH